MTALDRAAEGAAGAEAVREVVISSLGDYRLAIDASYVGSIADIDAETIAAGGGSEFFDLSDLVGLAPPEGARRMLEISGQEDLLFLVAGAQVRLQDVGDIEPVVPPDFLAHLWRSLHVQALLPTEPPALLLDLGAVFRAGRPSTD